MKEQDFEGALKKLEKIVEELESGELSLSDAIKRYEEGMRLSQFCTKKLHDIQKKIEMLVKDSSGALLTKSFGEKDIKTADTEEQSQQRKRSKRAEELLF